jgi:hypothetical protein
MHSPPDPEMKRAALAGSPKSQKRLEPHQNTQAAQDKQEQILRRFGFALAKALAPLIWGLQR